jgi:hypothetical protein
VGSRTRRRGWQVGALAAWSLWCAPLYADESPFRLVYQGPRECADAAEFARLVLGHSEHGRLVTDQSLARSMTVTIRRARAGYAGTLEFFDLDAERVVRELRAPTCRALAEALELVTALAIDAQLPPDAAVPGLDAPDEYIAPSLPRFDPEPMPPPPRPVVMPPVPPVGRSYWIVGAEGRIDTAAVPGVGWGLGGFVEAARFAGDARLRLGVSWGTGSATRQGENARFDWLTVALSACPLAFALGPTELLPCAALEVGGLSGQGQKSTRITSPETNIAPWVAVGVLGRLRAPLTRSVDLELEAGPTVPLTRPAFEFSVPDLPVFRPPSLGLAAGLGFGIRLQ